MTVQPIEPGRPYNNMSYLLRPEELRRCAEFEQEWVNRFGSCARLDPNAIFHLGDNPSARLCWTGSGRLPTLRRSMGVLWHPHSQTVVLPHERLSWQGWPVLPEFWTCAGLEPQLLPMSGKDAQTLNAMAANAYHVGVFGTLCFTCLACLRIA